MYTRDGVIPGTDLDQGLGTVGDQGQIETRDRFKSGTRDGLRQGTDRSQGLG